MTESTDKLCFPERKEVALTAARAAGKPLLTTGNLETWFRKNNAVACAKILKFFYGADNPNDYDQW